jgi:hypothetical protein
VLKILPLAISMICNVVLLNLSLAYSSIQFYQIVRVLVTPAVALMNYIIVRATIRGAHTDPRLCWCRRGQLLRHRGQIWSH